jgi:methylase of polypeptide subunit release factors
VTALVGARLTESSERIGFGGLNVAFDSGVLHPRQWTTMQAEWAAELARVLPAGPILELCSGAGHIGLLAAVLSGRRLVQVDFDRHACWFARLNAEAAGIGNRVDVRCGDVGTAVASHERFPLVIADPPYIPSGEVGVFPDDPPTAIDGGQDGFDLIRRCIGVARDHLAPEGACLLQVRGPSRVAALRQLLEGQSFEVRDHRVFDDERAVAMLNRKGGGA